MSYLESTEFEAFDALLQSGNQEAAPVSTPVSRKVRDRAPRVNLENLENQGISGCGSILPLLLPLLPKKMQQHVRRGDVERIESLMTHHDSDKIAELVMRLIAILKIAPDGDDKTILRVVDMLVSIVCIGYHKISKIFVTKPAILELSFHELMMKFGHFHYIDRLFEELAIIGISEEDTKSLSCSTIAHPRKCFFYNFAGRIVPSQDQVREILRKRSQPVVPVDSVVPVVQAVQAVQEIQVDPIILAEQKRKQELHQKFLNILD
jgi:hypothetical protein